MFEYEYRIATHAGRLALLLVLISGSQVALCEPSVANHDIAGIFKKMDAAGIFKKMHVGVPPSDTLMIARLKSNRRCFDGIIDAARSERNVSRIATGFVSLTDDRTPSPAKRREFLSDERWNHYKTLFSCAGIDGDPGGIGIGSNSVYLQAASWGLGGSGGEKGYVWTQTPVGPLVDSLDALSPAQRSLSPGMFYRHIDGPWYLMIDWD